MERLVSNFLGTLRRETLNGREYIVAPMALINPGVLNGSKGALYYPPDEVGQNVDAWNGIPIVVNHPIASDGAALSARSPDVFGKQTIGIVYNATFDDKLRAEAWFDVEATKRVDNRILLSLNALKPIEVSTGLFTTNEKAAQNASHDGTPYEFIARNYRPDHLAILPDQKGACSIADGCGVLVNESPDSEGDTSNSKETFNMAKAELVTELISNCSCWDEGDREALTAMSDEKVQNFLNATKKAKDQEAVANAAREGFDDQQGNQHVFNEGTGKWESKMKTPQKKEEKKPTTNAEGEKKPQTLDEFMAVAPPEIKHLVENNQRAEAKRRNALYEQIVSNEADDAAKKALHETLDLDNQSEDALEALAKRFGTQPTANTTLPRPSYLGQAGGPVTTNAGKKDPEPLKPPVINWEDESKKSA